MLSLKKGVSVRAITPQIVLAVAVIDSVFLNLGFDCVITSGDESRHSRGSLHYQGRALDIRLRTVPEAERNRVTVELIEALGPEYDVVLEADHWHVEYQPKEPL